MIDGIKPIETLYKGYRFRSRLEARWAVFFDALGVEWEYEPEGIQLSDGTLYLPDFWLPEFCLFFEVKSKHVKDTPEGKAAIKKISNGQDTGTWAGMICFGDPADDDMTVFCQDVSENSAGSYTNSVHFDVAWTDDPEGKHVILKADGGRDRSFYTGIDYAHEIPWMYESVPFWYDAVSYAFVENAMQEARQVRFEHGETPR